MAEKKGNILNASARDGVKYRKASLVQLILGQANAGCGIVFYMMMIWASFIGPQGYAIGNVLVGGILMGMRIFDGVTDAAIATAFEKMSPKLPKIRIFLISGWALAALGVMLMYKWAAGIFSGVAGVVVFILIYIVYIMGYTINGMGAGTIGIVITNDPTQRPMVGLISTIFSYVTPMVLGNICAFLILPKHDNQYNLACLGDMATCYVIIAGIFMLLTCWAVRKVDVPETWAAIGGAKAEEATEKKKKAGVSFKDIAAVLKDNRETQMYMLTCISDKFAQQIGTQSVVTTLMTGVLIGSYKASQMVGNVTMFVGLAFAFLGGLFVAKYGAKKSTIVWSWAAIILGIISTVFCVILGPKGMSKLGVMGPLLIIWCFIQIGFTAVKMILTTTGNTMRADVVDYELERSGNFFPAVLGGVYNFIDKLITSTASLIAGAAITLVGYTATRVPQMGDTPTWPILILAVGLTNILPIIGWLINVIAMKFYSLDKERMVQVAKNVADRKKAEQAQQA